MRRSDRYTPRRIRRRIKPDKVMIAAAALMFIAAIAIVAVRLIPKKPKEQPVSTPTPAPLHIDAETENAGLADDIPAEGGQLLIYIPTNSPTLDPLLADTKEMQAALSLIYDELITYDQALRLTPSLAESWETLDDSGLTWKINLRRGAYWHGTDDTVTANDVVYTISLLKSPEYASSPYAYHMGLIAGYEALDNTTLLITASNPGQAVLQALTFPVVPAGLFGAGQKPVGSGPYMALHGSREQGLELAANENWWKQPPYIKSVLVRCAADNQSALGFIELKKLNFVPSTLMSASSYREIGRTGMLELSGQQCETLLFNHRSRKLQDIQVRKAIAFGIDRREVISRAYFNHAAACDVPVPPDSWLYDSSSKVYDYSVEKAKACLAEAGWKDYDGDGVLDKSDGSSIETLRLTLLVNDTPANQARKEAAQLIAEQLKDVGIAVELSAQKWTGEDDAYLSSLKSGAFDIALAGFNMDKSYDISPYIAAGGENNYGGYSNAELDAQLAAMNGAVSDRDLKERAGELQKAFTDELPFMPLYFRTSFALYSETLRGINIKTIRDNRVFSGVEKWYFDAAGREAYQPERFTGDDDWSFGAQEQAAEIQPQEN